MKFGKTEITYKKWSLTGLKSGLHFQLIVSPLISMKKLIRKKTINKQMPVAPVKDKYFNFCIFLTPIKGL